MAIFDTNLGYKAPNIGSSLYSPAEYAAAGQNAYTKLGDLLGQHLERQAAQERANELLAMQRSQEQRAADKWAADQAQAAQQQYTGQLLTEAMTRPQVERSEFLRSRLATEGGFSPNAAQLQVAEDILNPKVTAAKTGTYMVKDGDKWTARNLTDEQVNQAAAGSILPTSVYNKMYGATGSKGSSKIFDSKGQVDVNKLPSADPEFVSSMTEKGSTWYKPGSYDRRNVDRLLDTADNIALLTGSDQKTTKAIMERIGDEGGFGSSLIGGTEEVSPDRLNEVFKDKTVDFGGKQIPVSNALRGLMYKDAEGDKAFNVVNVKGKISLLPNPAFNRSVLGGKEPNTLLTGKPSAAVGGDTTTRRALPQSTVSQIKDEIRSLSTGGLLSSGMTSSAVKAEIDSKYGEGTYDKYK